MRDIGKDTTPDPAGEVGRHAQYDTIAEEFLDQAATGLTC